MRFDDNRPVNCQWIKNLLKRIFAFHTFQINVFHIFPSPNPYFGALWEETGTNQRYFPFFSYTFFFHFSHPQIQMSGDLGKKWDWTPSSSFRIHFFLSPNPNFETLWEKMVLDPNRTGCNPFVTACVLGHSISIRQ